jgi:FdhD protein
VPAADDESLRRVERLRVRVADGTRAADRDSVAREEPLEIQVGGAPIAVVMRTPGHDEELVLGFLLTERIVPSPDDVVAVRHCSLAPDPEAADNVVRATLAPGCEVDLEALRRNLYASASCGICGKASIASVMESAPPLDDGAAFPPELFAGLPGRLREGQTLFAETGGLHAAALFSGDGRCLVVREDVGRHNAVDKVVGWAARAGRLPLAGHLLMVSGRISFEIAQKALAARVPLVAAISAPSSLAVELACASGMTLVGFLRDGGFNVYGNAERVAL